MLDYTVEKIGEMMVVGLERRFRYDTGFQEIPKFWSEYYAEGQQKKVCGALGICFDEENSPEFTYMIGCFCEPDAETPEGFTKRKIPAFTWAKFRSVGPMPDAIQKVNRQIFTEWLPNNNEYDMAGGVNIEMYTQGDMQAADYESEIWIPVRAKS